MSEAGYEAVIEDTFQHKPLRSVLMIDDEFPTYADLARDGEAADEVKFKQKGLAVALYQAFHDRNMTCDIENDAADVHAERFRKSDLIVLDYHLGPGANNSERSLALLRQMAGSKHFNTVVVYTAEPDLNFVWLNVMANVSLGWTGLPGDLEGDAKAHWERLFDAGQLPEPSREAIMSFAARRRVRDLPQQVRAPLQQELVALGVPAGVCGEVIDALLHREMAQLSGAHAGQPRRIAKGSVENEIRWIQAENAFVAILKKGADGAADDPGGIMEGLGAALLAWRPNLIQILTSEIQNILEVEALAAADSHLRDPVTQTALLYYLLARLGRDDVAGASGVQVALTALIDKIVEGVRKRLSTDTDLLETAAQALLGELAAAGLTSENWPEEGKAAVLATARSMARADGEATNLDVMFRLNSFLGTEEFRRAHVTTGTVFRHVSSGQYFVAASPACDLVARPPSDEQVWSHAVFPTTPLVAILLTDASDGDAVAEAANGLHLFVEVPELRKAFKTVVGVGRQPSYEFFMVKNKGLVDVQNGKTVFKAERLQSVMVDNAGELSPSKTERAWGEDVFEVVTQLRNLHATRLLLTAGQHLSRIGLDFISMPNG